MNIEIEEKDWRDRAEMAKEIIRRAKLDLLIWEPILDKCEEEIAKYSLKDKSIKSHGRLQNGNN